MSVTLAEAQRIIAAIMSAAMQDSGPPVAVSVVNAAARLICFSAMDHITPACIRLSQAKAYSAVMGACDTAHWAAMRKNPEFVDFDMRNWTDPEFSGFTGGLVLRVDGQVIGGIGVSGRKGKASVDDVLKQDSELAAIGRDLLEADTTS